MVGAGLLYPVLVGVVWWGTPLGLRDAALTVLLLELLPALALAQLPLLEEEGPLPRIPVYLSSAGTILILGWLGLLVGGKSLGDEAMGLGPVPWISLVGWTLGATLGALILLGLFHGLRRWLGIRESPLLVQLLPRTGSEKAAFAGLSLAAGVGEELAYRGYLIPTLAGLLGSGWGAALLSTLVFGILHAYQGPLGVVRTTALGFLLAGAFLVTGSLWPAILAHAILDLLAGLVLGETLSRE